MKIKTGQFECRILRDVMEITAQFSPAARMRIDPEGVHVGAVDGANASEIWIDIPADTFTHPHKYEERKFDNDIGINCEQLYRRLNAYEGDEFISFTLEHKWGVGDFVITSGTLGTLRAYQVSINNIKNTHNISTIRNARPPNVRCSINPESFRDWLREVEGDTNYVSFTYNASEKFPTKAISGLKLDPPTSAMHHLNADPNVQNEFRTHISLELLQTAIAPNCIDEGIKFAFGNDTPLFINTSINGCGVDMAIAPRIDV